MRIYLLNPPFTPVFGRSGRWQASSRGGTLYYPIWLAYACGLLEEKHQVRLVDAPAWKWTREEVLKDVANFQPHLVVVDTSFPSLANDISVAEAIKERLGAWVALVGFPTSQVSEEILHHNKGVDLVARGEYDYTLMEIAEALEGDRDLQAIGGLSYREQGRVIHNPDRPFTTSQDLERMPFVSQVYKRHLDLKDYFLSSSLYPEVQTFTGRGCPYLCTFCAWTQTFTGRKYRTRSITNVLNELQWIQENLPQVKEVFFEDDTFTIDKRRVLEFTQEYQRRGLKMVWACNARVGLDYETMRRMREANCRLLIVGYESGSEEVLRNIKKGITVPQIKEFARDAARAGLLVHADFIIGLPGETGETVALTKKLIKETRPDILQVSVASPFPGTEFYDWAQARGYLLTSDPEEYLDEQGHQKAILSYPELSHEEITRALDEILRDYYLSLSYIPIALRQVFRKNGWEEAKRLWRSARMFLRYRGRRK